MGLPEAAGVADVPGVVEADDAAVEADDAAVDVVEGRAAPEPQERETVAITRMASSTTAGLTTEHTPGSGHLPLHMLDIRDSVPRPFLQTLSSNPTSDASSGP
jgi:hypothetical protein